MGAIIGNGFESYVTKQISIRQDALSSTGRNEKNLRALQTNTTFIRLASSVNIYTGDPTMPGKSVLETMNGSGLFTNLSELRGDALAKNFVLFGGVTDSKGGTNNLYSGASGGTFGGAYGFSGGANERGPVPMPGITSCELSYKNDGALANASIKIKAFNKSQFQAIDVLYQRPGYTCLLEFGNSTYLDGTGEVVNRTTFATQPFQYLYKEKIEFFKLCEVIQNEKAKWHGNYEAMFGKITKFNWTFNSDGSYDITVTLVGMGDVINSLKINNAPSPKLKKQMEGIADQDEDDIEEANEDGFIVVADAITSVLNFELYRLYMQAQGDAPGGVRRFFGADGTGPTDLIVNNFSKPKFGRDGMVNGCEKPAQLIVKKGQFVATGIDNTISSDYEPQMWLSFGGLLAIIQSTCNIVDGEGSPLIYFNFDWDNLESDTNFMATFPGNFSGDPNVALIPYNAVSGDITKKVTLPETDLNTFLKTGAKFQTSNSTKGRIANVYLDINWIASQLKSNKNSDDEVLLLGFLKSILDGMNTSLGGLNDFRVVHNKDTGLIDILSEVPLDNKEERAPATINTFGVTSTQGSFVREMDLNSELSDKFATMITIGAQSDGNKSSGNATAFSIYNKGLIDRLTPVKNTSEEEEDDVDATGATTVKGDKYTELFDEEVLECFESIYGDKDFNAQDIGALKTVNSTFCSMATGALTNKKKYPAPFFLPFNLSLTLSGLSGMKIYEAFKIDGKALPPTYNPGAIQLIIKSLSHSVDGSGWTTKVETLSKPIFGDLDTNLSEGSYGSYTPSPGGGSGAGGGTQGNAGAPTEETPIPAGLTGNELKRREAMKKSYDATFNTFGEVKSMCGQYSYNFALNYVSYLRGDKAIPKSRSGGRPKAAGGNANQNKRFWENLVALGYVQTKVGTNISKSSLKGILKNTDWKYGDCVVYYANNGDKASNHVKYGHAQVWVGDIQPIGTRIPTIGGKRKAVGWTTSTKPNYGTSFVYNSKNSTKWDMYVFRAPNS